MKVSAADLASGVGDSDDIHASLTATYRRCSRATKSATGRLTRRAARGRPPDDVVMLVVELVLA
jgi:hypothetical protein